MSIAQNLAAVRERLRRACERADRQEEEVTLICVSKKMPPEAIRAAYAAGARDFGENYAQELRDKATALHDLSELRWHFIGPLQRNKVKYVVGRAHLIHSVSALEIVEEIDQRAAALGLKQDLLIQLNLAGEKTKSGISEEELPGWWVHLAACPCCRCVGLMTMPPFFEEPERARPLFARLRETLTAQTNAAPDHQAFDQLSMGMSGDFEVAIEEGATLVRIGTAIFGSR
jgi:PLP dependent protein